MAKRKWFIPFNVPSSKNGRRWTGKYFISSKTVMTYRKNTKSFYTKYAKCISERNIINMRQPVKIGFTFIRGTRHKFDYINPAQTVQDDMVKNGWIEDDNAEFIIPVFERYKYDKNKPGVIIEIIKDGNEKHESSSTDKSG